MHESGFFFNERIKIWSRNYSLSVAFAALLLQLIVSCLCNVGRLTLGFRSLYDVCS